MGYVGQCSVFGGSWAGTSTWTWQPTDQRVTTDVDGRDLGSIRRTAGRPGAIYANTTAAAGRPISLHGQWHASVYS